MRKKGTLLVVACLAAGLILCLYLPGVTGDDDRDTDGDDLTDMEEIEEYETDPEESDTDGDSLEDGKEVNEYETDPTEEETDGDGYDDGEEVDEGTDPLDDESYPVD